MDEDEFREKITKQLDLLISLVSRKLIDEEELKGHITKGSKRPDEMIKAYNMCDGETPIKEIAKKVGATVQAIGQNINKWDKLGLVIKIKDNSGQVYARHLYRLKR